jgi:hypothetical protein
MTAEVDTQSAAVAKMAEAWPMIDALVGGTGAMRAAGKAFLPQFPAEPDASYKARLSTATLFPAFARTAEVLAAKPLSKAITLDGVPPDIEALLEDVDGEGSTLHAYFALLMLQRIQYGLAGVLVDMPPAEGLRTLADEKQAGVRPYFATYKASSILECSPGKDGPSRVRLLECVTEPDGEWGEKPVKQVRVLTPGKWAIHRKVKQEDGRESWQEVESGVTTLKRIPFVLFGDGKPPLLDLAYQNITHWQSSSDQQTILHVARVPILYATGFGDEDQLTVGASSFVRTTNENAKIGYAEHTGAAIGAGEESIKRLEDQMRMTGAELLVQKARITTATQTVSEGEGSKSILQRIAESFQESIEECLCLMCEWRGIATPEIEVKLYTDFGAAALGEQTANTILAAVAGKVISPETGFHELKRRDLISPDVEWVEEATRIAAQSPEAEKPEDDTKEESHDADENAADGLVTK